MARSRVWFWCVAGAALAAPGCGARSEPDHIIDLGSAAAAGPAVGSGCASSRAVGAWQNQTFPDQTGRFQIEFDATPSASELDGVIGLSDGPATRSAQLAASVRFNPTGVIDVRAGSVYQADALYLWQAGTAYRIRIRGDVASHRYSVQVRPSAGGRYVALASDYPFRTEQAGAIRLDQLASEIDATGIDPGGALLVCGAAVIPPPAAGCVVASAGDGFVGVALPRATVLDTVTFGAQVDQHGIDAVIGLSPAAPAALSDLSAAVRFAPSGGIDAFDRDGYRADLLRNYPEAPVEFRLIADLTSHTYSAFLGMSDPPSTSVNTEELARQYRFRSAQNQVAELGHLSAIVEGARGSVTLCGITGSPSRGVVYSREGRRDIQPMPGDTALLSDGTATRYVDASGRELASAPHAGAMASDAAGNAFIAWSDDTGALTVQRYAPGLVAAGRASAHLSTTAAIAGMAIDGQGRLWIGIAQPTSLQHGIEVWSYASDTLELGYTAPGRAVAFDGDQAIVVASDGAALQVTRFSSGGTALWTREFTGGADVSALTVDPQHNLVLGGFLSSDIDFGGGTLHPVRTDHELFTGYIAKLSSTGAHVFSQQMDSFISGIASSGDRIVVSTTRQTQFTFGRLHVLDAAGNPAASNFATGFDPEGRGGRVAMTPSGRVWWNLDTQWPLFPRWPYLLALTL